MIGEPVDLRLLPGAHDARHRVAVGKADCRKAEPPGGDRQLLGLGGAAQEGEIRLDAEFGIGDRGDGVHAKSPCMNQRGTAPAAP